MSKHQTDNDPAQLSAGRKPTYIKEQHNNNCQQFFGPISNCQFIMPAPAAQEARQPKKAKPKRAAKPKATPSKTTPPKTLKYYQHGHKGLLSKQRERVSMLYKFWVRLGWIDRNTDPDDFDAFFEGKPRHCNITWTGNGTTLFFMLKELLLTCDFIEKQSHCSATSMVKEQFLKTPNADSYRLNDEDVRNIKLSRLILDTTIPLPEPKGRGDEEDAAEAGLLELLSNGMKITKGI